MKFRTLSVFFLVMSLVFPSLIKSQEQRSDMIIIKAMKEELNRSWEKLRLDNYESPYFISYQIKDNTYYNIKGKYGAIISSDSDRTRRLFVDVRVGNYSFDNSVVGKSGGGLPFQ